MVTENLGSSSKDEWNRYELIDGKRKSSVWLGVGGLGKEEETVFVFSNLLASLAMTYLLGVSEITGCSEGKIFTTKISTPVKKIL